MRKGLLLLLGAVLAGAVIAGVILEATPPPASSVYFTRAMTARIHKGMTEADVVAILGRPAGSYANPRVCFVDPCPDWKSDVWSSPEGRQRDDGTTEKAWVSDEGGVAVEFDAQGRVVHCYFEAMFVRRQRAPADQIRDLLRRFWP
jgi:hypothetical protein